MLSIILIKFSLQLVGASLFRPLNPPNKRKKRNVKEVKLLLQDDKVKNEEQNGHEISYSAKLAEQKRDITDKRKSLDDHEITFMNDPSEKHRRHKSQGIFHRIACNLANAMDLELLKDPIFISICAGIGLVYTSTINFSMLFPYFLQVGHSTFFSIRLRNFMLIIALTVFSKLITRKHRSMYVSASRRGHCMSNRIPNDNRPTEDVLSIGFPYGSDRHVLRPSK